MNACHKSWQVNTCPIGSGHTRFVDADVQQTSARIPEFAQTQCFGILICMKGSTSQNIIGWTPRRATHRMHCPQQFGPRNGRTREDPAHHEDGVHADDEEERQQHERDTERVGDRRYYLPPSTKGRSRTESQTQMTEPEAQNQYPVGRGCPSPDGVPWVSRRSTRPTHNRGREQEHTGGRESGMAYRHLCDRRVVGVCWPAGPVYLFGRVSALNKGKSFRQFARRIEYSNHGTHTLLDP